MLIKAKVARSECEADRASDLEALFASREEAKPPNILATVAGLYKSESGSLSSHEEKENGPIKAKPLFSYLRFSFSS